MYTPSNPQPEATDIIKGKVISTAKIQLADHVRIVAVFDTSTYYKFFFEFTAPNMRAPRSKWTYTKQYHMIYGDGFKNGSSSFFSLESYAALVCRRHKGTKVTIKRFIKSKELRAQIETTIHPKRQEPKPTDTFGVASRISSGQTGKVSRYDRAQAWNSWNEQHGRKTTR